MRKNIDELSKWVAHIESPNAPGDGRSLQTAHQKRYHLLELFVPDAKTCRDQRPREAGDISARRGARLRRLLGARQPLG